MKHPYSASELCEIFSGEFHHLPEDQKFTEFSIDSRSIKTGDLFFCIRGESTDGHLYVNQALENGAHGIIAEIGKLKPEFLASRPPLILVQDPNQALLDLSADYRNRFTKGRVLGITGSNGKTSSKEIAAGLCRFFAPETHATAGNFNNYFGVPLTILAATLEEAWWVIEMGTNQFGELETLSKVVRPHMGMITNIGESHLEFLKNTEGVAREKSGLFAGMTPGSIALIPATLLHHDIVAEYAARYQIRLLSYGFSHWEMSMTPDYKAELLSVSPSQSEFDFLGQTFTAFQGNPLLLGNLLGVLTLLYLNNVALEMLSEATRSLSWSIKGRMHFQEIHSFLLVDDTYNANPTSFESVLRSLKQIYPSRRLILVVGAMAELGPRSPDFHFQLGRQMRTEQVSHLLAFGDNDSRYYVEGWHEMKGSSEGAFHTADLETLVSRFHDVVMPNDVVLVKGSRSAKMERFVTALQEAGVQENS
ncbi:MAG: UDP-N-acetylmuramoyl-tripeptide--D-alanyl-D-alanine ligase [SAR324 cluster bacterium]|nr:UDP-N-acetylmuramoyl-tripeptide--D-alanyl-D-alanine ligase [SAR324 cluster bacterium]